VYAPPPRVRCLELAVQMHLVTTGRHRHRRRWNSFARSAGLARGHHRRRDSGRIRGVPLPQRRAEMGFRGSGYPGSLRALGAGAARRACGLADWDVRRRFGTETQARVVLRWTFHEHQRNSKLSQQLQPAPDQCRADPLLLPRWGHTDGLNTCTETSRFGASSKLRVNMT
jgi:hypothetical protein